MPGSGPISLASANERCDLLGRLLVARDLDALKSHYTLLQLAALSAVATTRYRVAPR